MARSWSSGSVAIGAPRAVPPGGLVPTDLRPPKPSAVLTPAAARAWRHRMLLLRQSAVDRIVALSGSSEPEIRRYHHELVESDLPELLRQRGAAPPFLRELPQGALLYLLVRTLRPQRVVETGIRPGYSTAWLLAGLRANDAGELLSLGPGTTVGRAKGVVDLSVGTLVPPILRSRWTLVLGNTPEKLQELLDAGPTDLFFYDNGPDLARARFELRAAWSSLTPQGILLAHRADANAAWAEFCRGQGLDPQWLDPGPPPLGALAMRR